MTRRASPWSTTPATCSSRRRPASWPTSGPRIADRTPHAAIGLAHTRWATHGRPNDLNAHPHQDCTGEITVIHNGIIENFRELRDGLEARGHTLTSETDTEALAHLVEEAYQGDLADAVRAALRLAQGAYAIVGHASRRGRPAGRRPPGRAARGRPRRRGELPGQRRGRHPRPHRPGRLPRGGRRRRHPTLGRDHHRRRRRRRASAPVTTIDWSPEAAEKGGYDTFMLKEIHEQPEALAQSLAGRVGRDDRIQAEELAGMDDMLRAVTASSSSPAGPRRTPPWSAPRRSRPGPACRRGSRSGRSSATARRRSTSRPWSSP